ncbi:MAG: DUF1569 domain-containing protein [Flavobacterium sp.]|nr:DUF1569 domain-containing protein [Flavobacterium sp.]
MEIIFLLELFMTSLQLEPKLRKVLTENLRKAYVRRTRSSGNCGIIKFSNLFFMSDLEKLVQELETNIVHKDKIKLDISKSDIAWQIDHSLKVINGIIFQLKNSNPKDYNWTFNLKRLLVFTLNKIPRGKATAPKSVQAFERIYETYLIDQIEISKKLISDIENLDKNCNFKHPYFDILNKKQTIKFLNIHTNHHLKIIKDILKV